MCVAFFKEEDSVVAPFDGPGIEYFVLRPLSGARSYMVGNSSADVRIVMTSLIYRVSSSRGPLQNIIYHLLIIHL